MATSANVAPTNSVMATRRIICAACRSDSSPIASLCRRSLVTSTSTSTLFPKNPLRCKRNISSFDQSFLGAQNNYFSHGMCNTPNWSVQSEKRNYKKINAYRFEYSASRWMSSKDSSKKSPYNILQVKVNASKDEIKAAFRKVRKNFWFELISSIQLCISIAVPFDILYSFKNLMT